MKKSIIISVIMVLMFLAWDSFATANAQDPAKEEKPTFYRLTPGVYVNGWPRFTITYPKDWVERRPETVQTFRVSPPGPVGYPALLVSFGSIPLPFETLAESWFVKVLSLFNTEVALVSDEPSRLRDGTPAREFEIRMVRNGAPLNTLNLVTKKDDLVRIVAVESAVEPVTGRIGKDLKAILYSIEFEPDKDKPVKLPPDVQEFLDKHGNDVLSHDVVKVMANYSDKYLNSGNRKGEVERIWRQNIGSITSQKATFTDFVPAGDRAYLTGFVIFNNLYKYPITETSIIKENGEWKWYGNQRDPAP